MRYYDTQSRESLAIAATIDKQADYTHLLSMWCGRCHVESRSKIPVKVLSDDRADLIRLLQRVIFEKWVPPTLLTREEWEKIRTIRTSLTPEADLFLGYAYAQNHTGPWDAWDTVPGLLHGDVAWRSLLRLGKRLDENSAMWSLVHREWIQFPLREHDVTPDMKIAVYINPPEDISREHMALLWGVTEDWLSLYSNVDVFMSLPYEPHVRFIKHWSFDTVYPSDGLYMLNGDLRLQL